MKPLLALAVLAACNGSEGTVTVALVTAPGSKVLDGVDKLSLIVTEPHSETDAQRTDGGFTLTLDLPAAGGSGALLVEGFDTNGNLVAFGESPPFNISGIDARIAVYMAPPMTIGQAPLALTPARSNLTVGSVGFGALFVGGTLASGLPSDATAIYNAYDHSITAGLPLPAPRAGVAMALDSTGHAVLFGGAGPDGQPTETLWGFDTTVAPTGAFTDLGDQAGFARSGEIAVFTGTGQFVVSGMPVVEFSSSTNKLVARTDVTSLPNVGTGLVTSDGVFTAVFAGSGTPAGYIRFRDDVVDQLNGDNNRQGGAIATIPNGQIVFVDGTNGGLANTNVFELDAAMGTNQVIPGLLEVGRDHPGIAATSRYILVAGGADPSSGQALSSIEVLDASSLNFVTTLEMGAPRNAPTLIALPNDSVLIAGGTDDSGQPVPTLELFTPDPPPQ